jgi:hypothetical protein
MAGWWCDEAEEALDEFGLVTSARVAMGDEKKWAE